MASDNLGVDPATDPRRPLSRMQHSRSSNPCGSNPRFERTALGESSDGGPLATHWRSALIVLLGALCYFAAFHRYGIFLQDEGVIAYQALRVSRGEVPYADFQTAYTPAGYYLHALLFEAFGANLAVLRAAASVACAATAALLYLAAVQVLRAPYTFLPSLLYVVLEDQESRGLVVHTMAYPARYITTLWALSLCVTLAHYRRRRSLLPVALGLVTAGIAAFKHTAGVYNAWAVGLALVLIGTAHHPAAPDPARAGRTAGDRVAAALPMVFLLALLAALPVLFGGVGAGDRRALLVLCLPLAAVTILLLAPMSPWPAVPARRWMVASVGADLWGFGLAAAAPTLLWIAYFSGTVGFHVVAQRLVLDGPAVARSYAIAFPTAGTFTTAAALFVATGLGAWLLGRARLVSAPTGTRIFGVACGIAALAALVWVGRLAGDPLRSTDWNVIAMHVGRQLDNLAFYLAAIIACAFLPQLAACLYRQRPFDVALVCWVHGLCQLLLAYPRLDVAHLYEGAVTSLLVGAAILERTVRAFGAAAAPRHARWMTVAVAAAVLAVGVTKLAPRLGDQLTFTWLDGPRLRHRTALTAARGGLYGTRFEDAIWFASLNRVTALVTERTRAGTPIFTYPALSGVYFLTGRDNPTQMDYFHQGFGEGADELAVVSALDETRTPLVVVMDDYSFDPTHLGYFPMLKDYIRRHYVQTAYFEPFRVLERAAPSALGDTRLFRSGLVNGDFATGDLRGFRADELHGATVEVVRQGDLRSGSARIDAVRFPGGPESYAVALRVPGGPSGSTAIVTSLPFVPAATELRFAVAAAGGGLLELLYLDPGADIVEAEATQVQERVILPVGQDPAVAAAFTATRVRIPHGSEQAVRVQFRLAAMDSSDGAFVLITNLDAGGDASLVDQDGDGFADVTDNCVALANADQFNTDGDRFGDACDNCPYVPNNGQDDRDADGVGNRCAVDITGDGFVDGADVDAFAAAVGGVYDARCDLNDDGRVDLLDMTLLARSVRVGIASDDLWDFTYAFVNQSVHGGIGLRVPRGMSMSAIPGSDLIALPGPRALMVRSGTKGSPAAEGVMTSLPFVPRGSRLTLQTLSESPDVLATVRVFRSTRSPGRAPSEEVLVEVPLQNERPATGPSARFETQTIDLSPWLDAEHPLRNLPIQLQFRQHTRHPGSGYFTLIGDVRTGPR